MLYFWLFAGILIFLVVTYMGLTEKDGFKVWGYYYTFPALAFLMFIVRRWMIKRMDRHVKWMEEEKDKEEQ